MQINHKLKENITLYERLKAALLKIENIHIDATALEGQLEKEIEKLGNLSIKNAVIEIANKAIAMNLCWEGIHKFLTINFQMSNTYLDELLAETASNEVALAMSRDQKTSVNALQKLAYIDNELVLAAIAGHKAAGENLLTTLAQSSFQQVRARVAANLNTLPTILSKFVADTDLEVLKSLANHPKLTEESMVQLAKTENIVVKQFLARNPNCSTSLLAQLIKT